MKKLEHLAIIMDGNGRWAESRKYSRTRGHVKGSKKAFDVINYVADLGYINTLSLFAFSAENWKRPQAEVYSLMKLLTYSLYENLEFFIQKNIKVQIIGKRHNLPEATLIAINSVHEKTLHNTGLNLIIAIDYSGKFDIINAVNCAFKKNPNHLLTEEELERHLLTNNLSDPDLIIRTGNETRLSNFFLWQAAYAEIHFERKLWPDFKTSDLEVCIVNYFNADRRFGAVHSKI